MWREWQDAVKSPFGWALLAIGGLLLWSERINAQHEALTMRMAKVEVSQERYAQDVQRILLDLGEIKGELKRIRGGN